MKKLFCIAVFVGAACACGTPKPVTATAPAVSGSKSEIKGNWTLHTISYDQTGTYNITLLADTSKECFEGSTWRFIPNNNTGTYTINNGNCPTGDRNFIFTIQEVNSDTGLYDFLLKPTAKLGKPDDKTGFRLRLSQLSGTSMQWEQVVPLDGG
ncbi:MAG: lipocalin family protein, partial [Marinirhabdus sp.]